MATPFEELLASSRTLPSVSAETAEKFAQAAEQLRQRVTSDLESNPDISTLIASPLQLMRTHHRNHATFIATVFRLNAFELLVRTVPWLYRAYRERGFSSAYFAAELDAWEKAIRLSPDLSSTQKEEILTIYAWLAQHHEDMVRLSENLGQAFQFKPHENQQAFLTLLLNGDGQGCLRFAEQSIHTAADLKSFYRDVVWPAMVIIGELWLSNRISVAEEHLATAIVGRVMAALYQRFAQFHITRGKAIVSAAPNEFHEVGARMVADFMELDGWEVAFLGANTPSADLLTLAKQQKTFLVALSVATVFNLDKARDLIKTLRNDVDTKKIKILVGGNAFNGMPDLWQNLGADGYAADAESAVQMADAWWFEENE